MDNTKQEQIKQIASKIFSIIEMVEVAGVKDTSFKLIRKKLLDAGNDVLRLTEEEGNLKG